MAKISGKVSVATVLLWGEEVGAVAWDDERGLGRFEYADRFLQQGFELAPLMMPRRSGVYAFPELNRKTFQGLPGLLADALPDRFGNQLIDLWLKQNGRSLDDFSPVERLCYMGTRGLGALEFKPAFAVAGRAVPVEVPELTKLANQILNDRQHLKVKLTGKKAEALNHIIRVGTSAGGNRAKAVIAWNPKTNEVRSGQVMVPEGFEPWILKFDGVNNASLGDPSGFGRIEFVYHQMARKAGLEMAPCRLMEENGRAHFMTRRFDRDADNQKIHMQSLCALAHFDFNAAGEYAYEQVFDVIHKLNLGHDIMREMFRRMLFNVVARNQDDHTRNTAFLMDRNGVWRLAPVFDVVWSFNPHGKWTNQHQLTINGKRDDFVRADLVSVAKLYSIKNVSEIFDQVAAAIKGWPRLAKAVGVSQKMIALISKTHRVLI
ncbi:MAG: hypothetical protein ACD_62C00670G0003 [uncultured bacterium]|nr:MAG: hypothetical protein ACD_62C00670G0003 [uncultured bacterium]HLD44144.1 type II toxin-antitoxin system HipA family toxin [bacterium]